jgi:UDP-N-acetylmuramate--alanine ligase
MQKSVHGQELSAMANPGATHFVGIGGVGMSGLAAILLAKGEPVSGSDLRDSATLARLREAGAVVHVGHGATNIQGARRVVYTTAIPSSNPEIQAANDAGLPLLHRAELLEELTAPYDSIAVTGTHGKTTTTALVALMFRNAGLDPTVLVGGMVDQLGGNAALGKGNYAVYEACESDNSFFRLHPNSVIVTNIDSDHLDNHLSVDNLIWSLRQFVDSGGPKGVVFLSTDCAHSERLRRMLARPVLTFGSSPQALYRADIEGARDGRWWFTAYRGDSLLGRVGMLLPGRHNAVNASSAIGVALEYGLPWQGIRETLESFAGVRRRFEIVGQKDGVLVMDDYAHHPTEIAALLRAAREGWRCRLVVVFQPHLFSRTVLLQQEFGLCFQLADELFVTDIYPAREAPIPGVDGSVITEAVKRYSPNGANVHYIADKAALGPYLRQHLRLGDMLLTVGAGDVRSVAEEFLAGNAAK